MTAWTTDHVERLTALWTQGRTAEQIARLLGEGVSRSAVLGKLHRLGLARHSASPGRRLTPARPARAKRVTPVPRCAIDASRPTDRSAADGAGPLKTPSAFDRPGRRTILTVGFAECRWPLGDPLRPGFTLCGCPAVRGAFCGDHAARAYRRAPDSLARLMALAGLT
jgi:GcrA cell cycle regulator